MKPLWILALILVLLYQSFLGCWIWSGSQLPERVATHFNGAGEANGWMNRSDHQMFMLLFGLAFRRVKGEASSSKPARVGNGFDNQGEGAKFHVNYLYPYR